MSEVAVRKANLDWFVCLNERNADREYTISLGRSKHQSFAGDWPAQILEIITQGSW